MCGRFAQYQSRDIYFDAIGVSDTDYIHDPEPIARYNVAPGTNVLLLNEREQQLCLDPVYWGYGPEWWNKQALINARVETAASSRMFKSLWANGRAIVFADGWFEWVRDEEKKQPYFIYHKDHAPLFFAAIGKAPFDDPHGHEGFLIVTSASSDGMLDIHDRRPLVLSADSVLEWLNEDTTPKLAEEIAKDAALPVSDFNWHPVSTRVNSPKNQGKELIERIKTSDI
ncbi:SOS response-associated peptidase family protein [Pantoea sp. JK]|uniref:SOS response-associated peptidase family protein n=1 Tax=Pantoea sp. JK TaxID=2871703 RepID=UPI0022390688|nr:SOS response-associated peptidase family protein [Pantoea sp. JK]MCW6034435.1 SOS response-associated peptidase family protein [Pantoea sp. JK]